MTDEEIYVVDHELSYDQTPLFDRTQNIYNTLLTSFIICIVLSIVSAANVDAFSRSLILVGEQNEERFSCAWFSKVIGMTFMCVLMTLISIFFFSVLCNALRMALSSCTEDIKDLAYEELSDS